MKIAVDTKNVYCVYSVCLQIVSSYVMQFKAEIKDKSLAKCCSGEIRICSLSQFDLLLSTH